MHTYIYTYTIHMLYTIYYTYYTYTIYINKAEGT